MQSGIVNICNSKKCDDYDYYDDDYEPTYDDDDYTYTYKYTYKYTYTYYNKNLFNTLEDFT
jgi:hypothetical protein